MKPQALDAVLLAVAMWLAVPIAIQFGGSTDLMALWLAGRDVSLGGASGLYPQTTDLFTLRPPEGWQTLAQDVRPNGPVFPYIYPPIWAHLLAPLTELIDFGTFQVWVRTLNIACLLAIPALVWRMIRPQMSALRFVLIAQIILWGSLFGALAIFEDQPHILLTFLVALSLERIYSGSPRTAGAALAVAAALKLTPVLLIVPLAVLPGGLIALISFTIVGGTLGGLSLVIAGWAQHAEFLGQISAISHTAIVNVASIGFDKLIAHYIFGAPHIASPAMVLGSAEAFDWHLMHKTPLQQVVEKGLMLGSIAVLTLALRRTTRQQQVMQVWPAFLTIFALLTPLGWLHYFILPICFAPLLLQEHLRAGLLLMTALLAPFFMKIGIWLAQIGISPDTHPFWGPVMLVAFAVAFITGPTFGLVPRGMDTTGLPAR